MIGDRRKPTKDKQVAELAATIRDAAHFEEIMSTVDPKMKRQVRQLLQQYVTFPMPDPLNPMATVAPTTDYRPTLVRKI